MLTTAGASDSPFSDRDDAARPGYRGRALPWDRIVQFHCDIAARAEETFFSLDGQERAERWSSIDGFDPADLAGPWRIPAERLVSERFRIALEQGALETVYLGGPGYVGQEKVGDEWVSRWRPILYREVEVGSVDGNIVLTPRQAHWQVSPLVYGLIDRMQARPDGIERLADVVLEHAARERGVDGVDQATAVVRALLGLVPELRGDLERVSPARAFRVKPSQWVLFAAANKFSALTRHLMRDYGQLVQVLQSNPEGTGGLRLLEESIAPAVEPTADVLPVVPLNAAQREAVATALGSRPLTVISGPPGCGKSQVVVSLLLNCWARGLTVLFASNNNKAVDVVRERLERFESEFPIAVRAGAKKYSNVTEVLRRTLNMASGVGRDGKPVDLHSLAKRRGALLAERTELDAALASRLPQRIDEALRAALTEYGESRALLDVAQRERDAVLGKRAGLGGSHLDPDALRKGWMGTQGWIRSLDVHTAAAAADADRLRAIDAELPVRRQRVSAALSRCGFEIGDGDEPGWLITGPAPDSIRQWESLARATFERILDEDLADSPWSPEYDDWTGDLDATNYAEAASRLAEDVRLAIGESTLIVERVTTLQTRRDESLSACERLGLDNVSALDLDAIGRWSALWAEASTLPPGTWDRLPWSRRAQIDKALRTEERGLRSQMPVAVWSRIGALDAAGHARLADTLDTARRAMEALRQWDAAAAERHALTIRFDRLRAEAVRLRLDDVPRGHATADWQALGNLSAGRARTARSAMVAWQRRMRRDATQADLRRLASGWSAAANGSPVRDAWRSGAAVELDRALQRLSERQDVSCLQAARGAFYTTRIGSFVDAWQQAIEGQAGVESLRSERADVPSVGARIRDWATGRTADALVPPWQSAVWPGADTLSAWNERLAAVGQWIEDWEHLERQRLPELHRDAQALVESAARRIEDAGGLLAEVPGGDAVRVWVRTVIGPEKAWPLSQMTESFRGFGPEWIRARIEGIDAELEHSAFDDAKARWLSRLAADSEAVRAVDGLERALKRQWGELQPAQVGLFRDALKVVPIWIVTAQSPQTIPLEPGLFDLVVIDEASQCTLTNLLPLMYRAKRLVVIGDENQLPAIASIQDAEETSFARKYGIEEHLGTIGHASNDVFKAAAEALPRRRGDIKQLVEHFRSHPLIIGFSNRCIYQRRLVLQRRPDVSSALTIGSGIHRVMVRGAAQRGQRGRSWRNVPEAEAVVEIVQRVLKDAPGSSIGVVTPFSDQKDFLRERMDKLGLSSVVLVDTAYGFQGDERDVIVFSAVVAKGITDSACRWVESPPNLVNVALTRAREALYVVADFDYCARQTGVLKQLALYCADIQTLRDTSPAELALYSWLTVEGLVPMVHPRIGDHELDFELRGENGVRVAIEVDGRASHENQTQADAAIDAYLAGRGYRVLRVTARDVLESPNEVVFRVQEALDA
jgi:very-short-patch-repair endonuclease